MKCNHVRNFTARGISYVLIELYMQLCPLLMLLLHNQSLSCMYMYRKKTNSSSLLLQELNNPILFLDVMRWCWHQDFRFRPMASDLIHSLESPSLPRLLDAISLHDNAEITSACLSTLPVEIVSPTAGPEEKAASSAAAQPPHVARGDLQEELWLCTFERGSVRGSTGGSRAVVVNFRGKASFCTEVSCMY